MSILTISAFQPQINWPHPGTTATLRYEYSADFVDSLSQIVLRGLYKDIPCTVAGGVISVPSHTIIATNDALVNPLVTLSARFLDERSSPRGWLFQQFQIPQMLVPITTMGGLFVYNLVKDLVNPPDWYLSAIDVQNLINIAIGTLNFASDVIYGRTRLSVAPVSAIDPIAVGDNDPRIAFLPPLATSGTDTLVAATTTTVAEALVAANSPIFVIPSSNGIAGTLHWGNRVAGVGFDVWSDEGMDAGDFRYFIYA